MHLESDMVIVETRARGYMSGDNVPLYNDYDVQDARGIVVHDRVVCPTCHALIAGAMQRDTKGRVYIIQSLCQR